jgi:hypothetical protein
MTTSTSTERSSLDYVEVTEQKRLNDARELQIPWKGWGPYLSERQWGTVREDYSQDGNAWIAPCRCAQASRTRRPDRSTNAGPQA